MEISCVRKWQTQVRVATAVDKSTASDPSRFAHHHLCETVHEKGSKVALGRSEMTE